MLLIPCDSFFSSLTQLTTCICLTVWPGCSFTIYDGLIRVTGAHLLSPLLIPSILESFIKRRQRDSLLLLFSSTDTLTILIYKWRGQERKRKRQTQGLLHQKQCKGLSLFLLEWETRVTLQVTANETFLPLLLLVSFLFPQIIYCLSIIVCFSWQ